jgi:REP element-mobilizing transposase RayT
MSKRSRKKQQEFTGQGFDCPGDCFGGGLLKGNPKTKRPLDSKLPIHLTLRAKKSVLRLPKNFAKVTNIIHESAEKHGVKIYKFANVGNHIHLALKIPRVGSWAGFIRELTGRIALACRYTKAEKGFWMFRPHTRIVRGWKKAFGIVKDYIYLNWCEAEGHISRKETKTLKDLRAIFSG